MGHNFLYILSSTFMEISHKPGFCTTLKSCIECFNKLVLWKTVCAVIPLPLIQTYAAALIANTSKNRMKRNVSRLLAVTRFTPNKIVLRSFPCWSNKQTFQCQFITHLFELLYVQCNYLKKGKKNTQNIRRECTEKSVQSCVFLIKTVMKKISFTHHKPSIKPLLSNKPPVFRRRKLLSLPPLMRLKEMSPRGSNRI